MNPSYVLFVVALGATSLLASAEALCICSRIYAPLCGSDGKTYGNSCTFSCEQESNPGLEIVRKGPCFYRHYALEETSKCICPDVYLPVCGSDGTTYLNECNMMCEKMARNPYLTLAHYGDCASKMFSSQCACNKMYKPVCGSDGVTYSNPCMLNCAKKSGMSGLRVVKHGHC